MKKAKAVTYPSLNKLKIPVYLEPIPHVKTADLDKVLTKEQMKNFDRFFGIQTVPFVDGKGELYPWDCESCLCRVLTGKITGNQRPELWD